MIGFVGLGIMGRPMAMNLLKAGYELAVYDINSAAVSGLVIEGAKALSLKEIGERCNPVFTILPNGTVVREVLFGKDGISGSMKPGGLVCDMSSVTPAESKYFASELERMGCGFVDAPVSGGEPGAVNGTLAFMAGGSETDFEALKPYFDVMGSSALLVGGNGSGAVTKLTNQVIVNMTIASVSEAFVLAVKAGADPEKVFAAIKGGLAGSAVLNAKIPMIMERNFKPGGKISINYKDIRNVLNTAHDIDVPMPLTSQLFEIMQALKVGGHMDEDHGGIVQYFEQLAGAEVKKPRGYEEETI